jgi:hypothetical protein
VATRESSGGTRGAVAGVFRLEGEYWTIAYEGRVVHLRTTKGLHYLAQLLRHPGRAFPVRELMAIVELDARAEPQENDLASHGSAAAGVSG